MAITRGMILEMLGLESPKESMTTQVKHLRRGPARLNRIRALIEGQKEPFEQYQTVPSSQKKPDVIFCNGILSEQELDHEELNLVRALLRETNTYSWRPDEFAPPAQFLHEIFDCHADSADVVREKLALRGIDPAKYIIVDYKKYNQMLIRYRQILKVQVKAAPEFVRQLTENRLDLSEIALRHPKTQTRIRQSVQPHEIHEFILDEPSEEDLEFIFQHFSNVTQLKIINPDADWFKAHERFIKKHKDIFQKLKLILTDPKGDSLFCPISVIPKLEIQQSVIPISILKAGPDEEEILESLSVDFSQTDLKLNNLENCHKLTSFKLHFPLGAADFPSLRTCSELRTLDLSHVRITPTDLAYFPQLTELRLSSEGRVQETEALNFAVLPQLQTLVIERIPIKLVMIGNPLLKHLTINSIIGRVILTDRSPLLLTLSTNQINLFMDMYSTPIQSLDLWSLAATQLNLSSFAELTSVHLHSCDALTEIRPPKKLQNLTISGIGAHGTGQPIRLDAALCPELTGLISNASIQSLGFDINDFTPFKKLRIVSLPHQQIERDRRYVYSDPAPLYHQANLQQNSRLDSILSLKINDPKRLGSASYAVMTYFQENCLDLKETQVMDLGLTYQGKDLCITGANKLTVLKGYLGEGRVQLHGASQLQSLCLRPGYQKELRELVTDTSLNNLTELILKHCGYLEIDLSTFPNLRVLIAEDSLFKQFDIWQEIKDLRSLEHLRVCHYGKFELNVSTCTNLISLEIEHCDKFRTPILPVDSHLRSLVIKNVKNDQQKIVIDLAGQRELRRLIIETIYPIDLINLQDCSELRFVQIIAPNIFEVLPDSAFHHLPHCSLVLMTKKAEYPKPRMPFGLEAKTSINTRNLQSSVTIFSPAQESKLYSQEILGPPQRYEAKGNLVLTIAAKKPIRHREFRKQCLNQIFYINKKLSFGSKPHQRIPIKDSLMPPFTPEMAATYKEMAISSDNLALGYVEGELKKDETSVVLMTDQSMPYDLGRANFSPLCNAHEPVSLSYDQETQRFYAESSVPQKIEILYLYQRRKDYAVLPDSVPELVDLTKLPPDFLPAELIADVEAVVSTIPELKFLANRSAIKPVDIPSHIQTIQQYCLRYRDPPKQEQVIPFLDQIKNQIGPCEQRAEAFMVLTRMMGVKTDIELSELHAYCEITYPGGDRRKIDLGGSAANDQTQRINPLDKYQATVVDVKDNTQPKTLTTYEMYNKIYQELVEESEIKSVKELMKKEFTFAPKLNLRPGQNPLQVYDRLLDSQEEFAYKELMYVEDPVEMEIYASSYRIENGKRMPAKSAFKPIVDQGGVILMNWTEFDARQRVTWQSMIDDSEPRIEDQKVDKQKVKIIGIDDQSSESCGAFLSRCQQCTVHPDFFSESKSKAVEVKEEKPLEINLFHRPDWMEQTLGDIDDDYQFLEGPLLRAIRENKPLVFLYNPPNDSRLQKLIKRINLIHERGREEKIYFNGEWIKTRGCKIITEEKPYQLKSLNKKFHLVPGDSKKQRINIGLHNLYELYGRERATHKKRPEKLPGFLKSYNNETDIFYFTESIPLSFLCILENYLDEHCPGQHFDYQLAPGVRLEGLTEAAPLVKQERSDSPVIFSQDPDLTVELLRKEMKGTDPLIVHLTPDMEFADLAGEQTFNEKTGETEYKPGFLLKALLTGPVIITGAMDPLLFHQLWPLLFDRPPRIHVNGEFVHVKGPLIAVMPSVCEEHIPSPVVRYARYGFQEYRKYFPDDQKLMDQIERFYLEAAKIPLGRPGLPEKPIISYARLKAMISALKVKKLHPHNPIKGLFLHDYFKGSEEYARLNVIAKLIFRPDDDTDPRLYKLKQLLEKIDVRSDTEVKKQAWRILNCLNGAQLKDYLDVNFKIDEQQLLKLVAKVKYSESKSAPPQKKSHVAKRKQQLDDLIHDPNAQLIMLMGEPGVGKTFEAGELKKHYPFYEFKGSADVKAWREDTTPDKVKLLFIDEANRYPAGTFDFLKSDLSPDHKVIFAANFSKDPGRCRHDFFDRAHVIFYEMPEDDFLREHILFPKLGEKHKNKADIFLAAFHLAREHNPYFPYSNRELQNAVELFKSAVSDQKTVSDKTAYDACVMEFAGSIRNKEQRKAWMEAFAKPSIKKTDFIEVKGEQETLFFPPEKAYLLDALAQAFVLRDKDQHSPLPYFKRGILVEGKPGSGKTSLFKAMCHERGLKYYQITPRNKKQAEAIMKEAFHEGLPLVMDELGLLSTKAEALLDSLLVKGVDDEGKPAKKRGFMILGSLNPGWDKGRTILAPAVLSRFHVIYMDSYDPSEQKALAAKKTAEPDVFVQVHKEWERRYPDRVNDRTFFNALKRAQRYPMKQSSPHLQTLTVFQPQSPAAATQPSPKPKSKP